MSVLAAGPTLAGPSPVVERAAPQPVTAVTSEQLRSLPASRDLRGIFDYHNQLRAEFGSPPLRWNSELAAGAAAYGQVLSQSGTLTHASREGRKTVRENLLQSPRGVYSPMRMVQVWGTEKKLFRPGIFPNVSSDGSWASVGHYTQMVWPTTTEVGCALHSDARYDWLICRYSPPGNRDGVAIGPSIPRLAGGLCTSPTGTTIPCNNDPKVAEDGGLVDGGGGGVEDGGKGEEVCPLDVNVHKPISVAPDEPVVRQVDEFTIGATTLRNDDSDWQLAAEAPTGELPIVTAPTDLIRNGNPNENDLVRIDAINQAGVPNVYLFAFPTDAEADLGLDTPVKAGDGRQANRANKPPELGYFTTATKGGAAPGLPRLIPQGTTTFWVEARLGGKYRFVIGDLKPGVDPAKVSYNRTTGKTDAEFTCEDQATVTAAVVDIFQKNTNDNSLRLTAFDVYWAGRPHFRAKVWPGGNTFTWGEKYRLGAAERSMPGTAVDGTVASMVKDAEDVDNDRYAEERGAPVAKSGVAGGAGTAKGSIEGGFQIDKPEVNRVPTVNRNRGDRYPNRVSVKYQVNGEPLVRAEYLEVILPEVRPPAAAGPVAGKEENGRPSTRRVASEVQYEIVDAFNREITAKRVDDYLYLYGAGIKAWEALGQQPPRVIEGGPGFANGAPTPDSFNDFAWVVQAGAQPIRLGTAQRSQAAVHANRMIDGRFQDTLIFFAPEANNAREAFWRVFTGQPPNPAMRPREADAQQRAERIRRRQDLPGVQQDDLRRIVNSTVLAIPQDVILQLRVGAQRHDVMVFQDNMLTVFAPYFFDSPAYPGNKSDPVFRYHIEFRPGRPTSVTVDPPHRRP